MPKRILVVDDEEDVTQLIEFNLRRAGYDVSVAHTGVDGLEQALSDPPDLVVLDVNLPEVDGFALCESLRADPRTMALPIIMLTAFGTTASRAVGMEAGADDYLLKPFSPRELTLRIGRLIEQRHPAT